jgi:hypothetical protein
MVNLLFLIGTGVGLIAGAVVLISNGIKRKNIVLKTQKQKSNVLEILHSLVVEFTKVKELYNTYDDVSNGILETFVRI